MKALYVTLSVIIVDQITKLIVKGISIPFLNIHLEGMSYGESINVIGDFFKITFVENPGLAFGIDVNDSAKLALSIFSLIASIGIFYYLYKSKHQKLVVRVALALILGGAIGNMIDRTFYGVIYGYAPIFYGRVVDFFNVDFFDFTILGRTYDRWPIFNIADASVTVGVILLVIFHSNVKEDLPEKETAVPEDKAKEYDELSTINLSVADVQDSNGKEN
ncbi:putative signal peptidase [Melioribacter roseus P3M-2]|uniref:Lipoprotein signal peptidase n=1 Tax=Melioribacter roseus (strain DSM 23840 / JCM 17771 / VKM B-2668 / P3M-2) TaxID=1191523 RepID=I6ZTH5_MELRP|nr:signal peptidase II [Melioribacter roseus]AFN75344.1 putative signal peptidase [Melioribacter roseus P3M-2]